MDAFSSKAQIEKWRELVEADRILAATENPEALPERLHPQKA
jgi:hypothetical protein